MAWCAILAVFFGATANGEVSLMVVAFVVGGLFHGALNLLVAQAYGLRAFRVPLHAEPRSELAPSAVEANSLAPPVVESVAPSSVAPSSVGLSPAVALSGGEELFEAAATRWIWLRRPATWLCVAQFLVATSFPVVAIQLEDYDLEESWPGLALGGTVLLGLWLGLGGLTFLARFVVCVALSGLATSWLNHGSDARSFAALWTYAGLCIAAVAACAWPFRRFGRWRIDFEPRDYRSDPRTARLALFDLLAVTTVAAVAFAGVRFIGAQFSDSPTDWTTLGILWQLLLVASAASVPLFLALLSGERMPRWLPIATLTSAIVLFASFLLMEDVVVIILIAMHFVALNALVAQWYGARLFRIPAA
jgi:hypothetical protein